MSRLLAAAPTEVARASDLQRALKVRAPLAWQAFRLATASDPFGTVPHIPQAESMAKVLHAARKRGFRTEAVDAAASAYAEFDRFVDHHAGNRGTFDGMIAALGREASEQIGLRHRRAAFRANTQLWGFQARMRYSCCMRHPGASPGLMDTLSIRGWVALHALRDIPSIPLVRRDHFLTYRHAVSELEAQSLRPMLLEDFCSKPLPTIKTVREGNIAHEMLHLDAIGRTARVDCFIGDRTTDIPWDVTAGMATMISTPCEELVMDFLTPCGSSQKAPVRTATFGSAGDVQQALTMADRLTVPSKDSATYLGTSLEALDDPVLPRCPEMVGHVLRQAGLERMEFDIFRCRARFPILHTVVILEVTSTERK
jgi:hypothetical protein